MTEYSADYVRPPPSLDDMKQTLLFAVQGEGAARVRRGFASGGRVLDLDADGRADLNSMFLTGVSTLMAVLLGVSSWPANYSKGWVTRSGERIPLPKPSDGIALASAALNYYSAVVQREADLSKAVAAAPDMATLTAIDITAGWPSAS